MDFLLFFFILPISIIIISIILTLIIKKPIYVIGLMFSVLIVFLWNLNILSTIKNYIALVFLYMLISSIVCVLTYFVKIIGNNSSNNIDEEYTNENINLVQDTINSCFINNNFKV